MAISSAAGLLSTLSSLRDADTTRFKHLMGELGSNLKAAANPHSGQVGSELGGLADQLLKVAKTGDLSALASSNGPSFGSAQRAVEAYKRHVPQPAPSETVQQALAYVKSAALQL